MSSIAEHFQQRSANYDSRAHWVKSNKLMRAMLQTMTPQKGMNVLDVGAGTGAVLNELVIRYPKIGRCVALDISLDMLKTINNPRINRINADGSKLPFASASFNLIICRQSLHYISNIQAAFEGFYRVLSPNGILAICQIVPFNEIDEPHWERIIRLRQPLRQHCFNLDKLLTIAKLSSFKIASCHRIVESESVNSILGRYNMTDQQVQEIRNLYTSAPKEYRDIHRFRKKANDILYDNCWALLRLVKD